MSDFFKFQLESLMDKFPTFVGLTDYRLFTLLCIKYFFYSDASAPFDQDMALSYLTDGPNDGGIDAIFNDPTSEGNDVIIVQSKYYNSTPVTGEQVIGELYKIAETVKYLKKNKVAGFNPDMVTAYRNATSEMEDSGVFRVYFFTSFKPSHKKDRNKLVKSVASLFGEFDETVLSFGDDIEAQVELCDNSKLCVEYDKIFY